MAEIASAYVSLIPSFKGGGAKIGSQLAGPVDQAGKSSGKRFGNAMSTGIGGLGKKIFAPLALAAGAIGVGNFLKGAIGEARESQKVGAITAQVIKTTGGAAKVSAGQVDALATAISNKTGIDDEAISSASNLLLTFTNVRNEVGKNNDVFNQATKIATDMGAALGKEPKAAAIQLGKALNDPVKGITALSRVGVSFTEQQKEQIKTMTKAGDTVGAQKVILGELNKEFGGTAEASASAGDKFKTTFGNFKEAIGTAILPVLDAVLGGLTKFVGFLTTNVAPVVKKLAPIFKPIATAVDVFFEALGGGDVTVFGTLGKIGDVAYGIRDAFKAAFPIVKQFVTGGLKTLAKAGGSIMSSLGPVLKQLPGLFAQLLPVLATVGKTILSVFKGAFTQIGPLIATVAGVVIGLFKLIAPAVAQLAPVIGSFLTSLQGLAGTLIAAFQVVWPPIKALIAGILTQLVPGLKAIFAVITGEIVPALKSFALAVAPIVAWLVNKLAPVVTTVFGVVVKVVKSALKIVAGVIKLVTSVIKGDWSGAWDAIKGILSAAWDIIKTVVKGAITIVKSVLSTGVDILKTVWSKAWDAIKAAVSAIWEKIKTVVSTGIEKLKTGVSEGFGKVVDFVKELPAKIVGALGDLGGMLLDAGGSIIQGLIDGIGNAGSALSDFIVGFIKDHVPGPILSFLGIKSPSKLFADMGEQIPAGLIKGISSQKRAVDDTMRKLVNPDKVKMKVQVVDPAKLKLSTRATSVPLHPAGVDATAAAKAKQYNVTYTGPVTVTDHKEFARQENTRLRDLVSLADLRGGL